MAGGMQMEDEDEHGPDYVMPYVAYGAVDKETSGGSTVLQNTDEADMNVVAWENMRIVEGELSTEMDQGCQDVYRRRDLGGS